MGPPASWNGAPRKVKGCLSREAPKECTGDGTFPFSSLSRPRVPRVAFSRISGISGISREICRIFRIGAFSKGTDSGVRPISSQGNSRPNCRPPCQKGPILNLRPEHPASLKTMKFRSFLDFSVLQPAGRSGRHETNCTVRFVRACPCVRVRL